MKYYNPVIGGFYPDPSICKAGDKYYLVSSSFQYFPGVPLFESEDLVNWNQIGYCLTRSSQVDLKKAASSGGIFAPTIRYYDGRFYMVTTNVEVGNFYIWTDNIHGEWSEPVFVEQDGIDPSLYFEGDKAYFMSNGMSDDGIHGITQCEIEIKTGRKLSPSRSVWQGTGGRYLESPHLYKINGAYYLMAAEGGTEYGHMVVYAKGSSPYGPFESYAHNPVLTNRNKGGYLLQGVGHADLIEDAYGNWWMVHLAFRQTGRWNMHHHLGREVYLVPVTFDRDGWFCAGEDGFTPLCVETDRIPETVVQEYKSEYTFANTDWNKEWCMLRVPDSGNYSFMEKELRLKGTRTTLDMGEAPTFIGIRQKDMEAEISCEISVAEGEAGITVYMDEMHHYDLAVRKNDTGFQLIKRICIGDIKYIQECHDLSGEEAFTVSLGIHATSEWYEFYAKALGKEYSLGSNQSRYLSSEVAGGFTGVMLGLYAQGDGFDCTEPAVFREFSCKYQRVSE